jgi:hypothetical protein
VHFFIGGVRDKDRLARAGPIASTIICPHAATKIVPTATYNPFKCIKTNVFGAMKLIKKYQVITNRNYNCKMKQQIKKIIGFDSWTRGAHHYQRLLPAFATRSMQLTLVHIGSWGNDPDCPSEQQIGGLMVRDIRFYGGDDFERILDMELPDAVILLSTQTFAHRAFIRYCRQRSIPTLNLYHGLVNVQDYAVDSVAPVVSRVAHMRFVFSRIGKLFQHTLPCYVKSLLKTQATYKDWGRFLADIYNLATGVSQLRGASDDAKTSKCAVYVEADVEHAMHCYGVNKEDVVVVGNPDFLQFNLEQGMIGHWQAPEKVSKKTIMYIETGFASEGFFFKGVKGFSNHIINTSRSLATQGFQLCIKLKPHQEGFHLIEQSLKSAGIELVSNEAFLPKLMACSACIVETTTLAMVPTMMGMPLLLAQYGDLKSMSFGSVLTSYPRSYFLQDISGLSDILKKDAQTSDSTKLNAWVDLNVGPLPPEKMPERVEAIVEEMIAGSNRPVLT